MTELSKYNFGEPIGTFEGRDFYGGDCWGGMPALFMKVVEETGGRHAETEEEWEFFGARLPEKVTVLRDVEVGCEDYQALLAAGKAIAACASCPLIDNEQK